MDMRTFARAEAEYYDHDRYLASLGDRHEPSPVCICDDCRTLYDQEDESELHDWRSCGCDACSLIYAEYEREMT